MSFLFSRTNYFCNSITERVRSYLNSGSIFACKRFAIKNPEPIKERVALSAEKNSSCAKAGAQYLLVNLPCEKGGMFAVMLYLLGVLDEYQNGKYAGIEIQFKDVGYYYNPAKGLNWWCYYFNPVKIGNGNEKNIKSYNYSEFVSYKRSVDNYKESGKQMSRELANRILMRFFHLKPELQAKIDQFALQHFSDQYVISMHYRGTDKAGESSDGFQAPRVSYETMIEQIRKHVAEKRLKNFKIFLASDEQAFVNIMEKTFPGKIITTDVKRSTNGEPLHKSSAYNLDPFQTGEGAIMDCWLLARGEVLIRTSSNLSLFSTYINPKMPVIEVSHRYRNRAMQCAGVKKMLNKIHSR